MKRDLERFGCVEPLVWNESSGNLVSGHQRLSIIDEIEGRADYILAVSVVKLDDKREKELNILLNNTQAMGEYDAGALLAMLPDIDMEAVGLTHIDIEDIAGNSGKLDEANSIIESLQEAKASRSSKPAEKLNKNDIRKDAATSEENDAEYFIIVSFPSYEAKAGWLKTKGLSDGVRLISSSEAEVFFAGKQA